MDSNSLLKIIPKEVAAKHKNQIGQLNIDAKWILYNLIVICNEVRNINKMYEWSIIIKVNVGKDATHAIDFFEFHSS